jgi:hypothetical protein
VAEEEAVAKVYRSIAGSVPAKLNCHFVSFDILLKKCTSVGDEQSVLCTFMKYSFSLSTFL